VVRFFPAIMPDDHGAQVKAPQQVISGWRSSLMTGDSKITAACRKNANAATMKQASAPCKPPMNAPMAAPSGRAPYARLLIADAAEQLLRSDGLTQGRGAHHPHDRTSTHQQEA